MIATAELPQTEEVQACIMLYQRMAVADLVRVDSLFFPIHGNSPLRKLDGASFVEAVRQACSASESSFLRLAATQLEIQSPSRSSLIYPPPVSVPWPGRAGRPSQPPSGATW